VHVQGTIESARNVVKDPLFRPAAAILSGFLGLGFYLHNEVRGVDTKLSNEIRAVDTKLSNEIREQMGLLRNELATDRKISSDNFLALNSRMDKLLENFKRD
jgi:hypothetical protein